MMEQKRVRTPRRIGAMEKGASMIEYALLLAAIVAIALWAFSDRGDGEYGEVGQAIYDRLEHLGDDIRQE